MSFQEILHYFYPAFVPLPVHLLYFSIFVILAYHYRKQCSVFSAALLVTVFVTVHTFAFYICTVPSSNGEGRFLVGVTSGAFGYIDPANADKSPMDAIKDTALGTAKDREKLFTPTSMALSLSLIGFTWGGLAASFCLILFITQPNSLQFLIRFFQRPPPQSNDD